MTVFIIFFLVVIGVHSIFPFLSLSLFLCLHWLKFEVVF